MKTCDQRRYFLFPGLKWQTLKSPEKLLVNKTTKLAWRHGSCCPPRYHPLIVWPGRTIRCILPLGKCLRVCDRQSVVGWEQSWLHWNLKRYGGSFEGSGLTRTSCSLQGFLLAWVCSSDSCLALWDGGWEPSKKKKRKKNLLQTGGATYGK